VLCAGAGTLLLLGYWLSALSEEKACCLVVENKDTFHSLKYLLGAGKTQNNPEIHLLIYGEGKKIFKQLVLYL